MKGRIETSDTVMYCNPGPGGNIALKAKVFFMIVDVDELATLDRTGNSSLFREYEKRYRFNTFAAQLLRLDFLLF